MAGKLQRITLINLVADRLIGFDGFLEARGRIGDLVRERQDDFAGAVVGNVVGHGVPGLRVEANGLLGLYGLGGLGVASEERERSGDNDSRDRAHGSVPSDPVFIPRSGFDCDGWIMKARAGIAL